MAHVVPHELLALLDGLRQRLVLGLREEEGDRPARHRAHAEDEQRQRAVLVCLATSLRTVISVVNLFGVVCELTRKSLLVDNESEM